MLTRVVYRATFHTSDSERQSLNLFLLITIQLDGALAQSSLLENVQVYL